MTYAQLSTRLARLAASLLPADRPFGGFTPAEQDLIHSYVVLTHAELEYFLENLGKDVVTRAKRSSIVGPCAPVISRLIFLKSKSTGHISPPTQESIENACNYYDSIVENNHGLKARNVMRLFMPLGLTHKDFDTILLANLDAFGNLRGEFAHTSSRLTQGTQPSSEKKKVDDILSDLSHLDQRVRGLL
jgi:hypothetical protein